MWVGELLWVGVWVCYCVCVCVLYCLCVNMSVTVFITFYNRIMQEHEIFELAGLRIDGRRFDEVRPMDCRLGFISHVDGSAYLEHGLNKVLAMIVGPHEPKRRGDAALNDECVVECQIIHAPFSRSQRKKRRQVYPILLKFSFVLI